MAHSQWRSVPSTLINPAVGFSRLFYPGMGGASACLTSNGFSQHFGVSNRERRSSGFSLMELFRMEAESHTATLSAGLVSLEGTSSDAGGGRPSDACRPFAQGSRPHCWA